MNTRLTTFVCNTIGYRKLFFVCGFVALLAISPSQDVYAMDKDIAALREHLKEMDVHMAKMDRMLTTGSGCPELKRHMGEMTEHMKMMMKMMENMHQETSRHDMKHS